MKKQEKIAAILVACSILTGGIAGWRGSAPMSVDLNGQADDTALAVEGTEIPLVIETSGKMKADESVVVTPSAPVSLQGEAIVLRVFVKNAYDAFLYLDFGFTDTEGKKYGLSPSAEITSLEAYAIAPDGTRTKTEVSLNKNGKIELPYLFYGDVVLPYSVFNASSAPADLQTARFTLPASGANATWLSDESYLSLFALGVQKDGNVSVAMDMTELDDSSFTHEAANGAERILSVRKATLQDRFLIETALHKDYTCDRLGDIKILEKFETDGVLAEADETMATTERERKLSKSGQPNVTTFVGVADGDALKYTLRSEDYDAARNSYAGTHLHFTPGDAQDWSGAKGITMYVINEQSYTVSFAAEIFQYNSDTRLVEQYNLNSSGMKYKTVYAYDVNTGLEYSYHTQTFMRVPAHFEGWIRIPFSQYDAPEWSLASTYGNRGVLDFEKYKILKVSFTRLFSANQDTSIIVDNLGIYYNDFGVGQLFDETKPSIAKSLNG